MHRDARRRELSRFPQLSTTARSIRCALLDGHGYVIRTVNQVNVASHCSCDRAGRLNSVNIDILHYSQC